MEEGSDYFFCQANVKTQIISAIDGIVKAVSRVMILITYYASFVLLFVSVPRVGTPKSASTYKTGDVYFTVWVIVIFRYNRNSLLNRKFMNLTKPESTNCGTFIGLNN